MNSLDLGRTDLVKHHIELKDYTPIVRSRLSTFQEFRHRAGEPARSRPLDDQFEFIQEAGQVE